MFSYLGHGSSTQQAPKRAFRIMATRTDQNGVYKLANVVPGEYNLIALDTVEAGAMEDEEYVKQFLPKVKKVKVENSDPLKLDLVLVVPET